MRAVYLASPLGFTPAGRAWHDGVLVPALEAAGWRVLDPWAMSADLFVPGGDLSLSNALCAQRNADAIRSAAAVLAVLDGPDVDSGTAAEVGYACALGVRVVGLRTDLRTSGDNAAATVNLQVEGFVVQSGGALVFTVDDAVETLGRI